MLPCQSVPLNVGGATEVHPLSLRGISAVKFPVRVPETNSLRPRKRYVIVLSPMVNVGSDMSPPTLEGFGLTSFCGSKQITRAQCLTQGWAKGSAPSCCS